MKLFNRSLLLILFVLCIFLKIDAVQAETKINSMISTDSKISGTAESNQKLMLLHKGEWLNTTASQDGAFTFSLSSSVGDDILILKSQQEDGIFRETQKVVPADIAKLPPVYKGIQQNNWVFESRIPDAEIFALIDGTVYSAQGELHVTVKSNTTAKIYSIFNNVKSDTIEIPITTTYEIPFMLDESQIKYNRLKGQTLPNISFMIRYNNEMNSFGFQLVTSDQTGKFNVFFDYYSLARIKSTFTIDMFSFEDNVTRPQSLQKIYQLPKPVVDEIHPVLLSPDILYKGNSITGFTSSETKMVLTSSEGSKDCYIDSSDGFFQCMNVFDSSDVNLTAYKNQKIIWTKELYIQPREEDSSYRKIKNFKSSSTLDYLSGNISMRFAYVKITYTSKDYKETFSIHTKTDGNGDFKTNFPPTVGGNLSFKAKPTAELNYIDFETMTILDDRIVPTPIVIYDHKKNLLTLKTSVMKDASLSAKVTIIRKDNSFSSISLPFYGQTASSSINLNSGDRIIIRSFNEFEAQSNKVEALIQFPQVDLLNDTSTFFTGQTIPNQKFELHFLNEELQKNIKIELTSDTQGKLEKDYSELTKEGFYPTFIETKNSNQFSILNSVSIQDTTPPLIRFNSLAYNSSALTYTIDPHPFKGVDCRSVEASIFYKDGTIEKKAHNFLNDTNFKQYSNNYFLNGTDFSKIEKIEVTAVDFVGNRSNLQIIKPIDMSLPKLINLNSIIAGDTHITGLSEKETRVEVKIKDTIFFANTDSNGEFDVIVPKLSFNELVTLDIVRIESGVRNSVTTKLNAIGISDVVLLQNRNKLQVKSNVYDHHSFKVLISDGQTIQHTSIDSSKKDIHLNSVLNNHASLKISVLASSGRVVTEKMYKFSDTTPPSKPAKVSFNNEDNYYLLYGRAEADATFELLENGKLVKKMKVSETGEFKFKLDPDLDVDIRSKWTVRITDVLGNSASYPIYPKDVRAPAKPRIVSITNNAKIVQGMINEYATVYLKWNGKTYRTTTDDSGNFSLAIQPLSKGTTVTAYAVDLSGNKSSLFTTKVLGVLQLTGSTVTSKSTSIFGKGTPGSIITLYKADKKLGSTTVLKNGTYTLKFSRQSQGSGLTLEAKKSTYKTKELTLTVKK